MKRSKYTEEQIVRILKESEAGISVTELCRKYEISDATYYNWKAKFGGMELSDVRRLKQLEEENRRPKTIVADLTLDNQALKAVVRKKLLKPKARRKADEFMIGVNGNAASLDAFELLE